MSRALIVRAAGVFITSTVVFAALIVIASGLGFSEPTQRFLPTAERALPGDGPDEIVFDDGSATDSGRPFEVPVAVVTAAPATPDELAAAGPHDPPAVSVDVPLPKDSAPQRSSATPATRPRQTPRAGAAGTAPDPSPPGTPPSPTASPSPSATPTPQPTPQQGPPSPSSPTPSPPASEDPTPMEPSVVPTESATRLHEPPEQWSEPPAAPEPSPAPSPSPTAVDQASESATETTAESASEVTSESASEVTSESASEVTSA